MGRLFGTDGVRGLANESLTPELALQLANAAAQVLAATRSKRPIAVVGRDPRASGEMLEAAVIAGLTSAGVDVLTVGVLPTPAVAYLTGRRDACLGVMISASHNPMPDNGIKIFAAGGHKLDDDIEDADRGRIAEGGRRGPTGAGIGRVARSPTTPPSPTSQHLAESARSPLDGLTVVVDCAHGAASEVGPAPTGPRARR